MSIRFCWFGNVYELFIGRKTPWLQSVDLISLQQLWFDNLEVTYAVSIFTFGRKW